MLNIKGILVGCRRSLQLYIFILDWPGFNRLRKNNCKARRETLKFLDLVSHDRNLTADYLTKKIFSLIVSYVSNSQSIVTYDTGTPSHQTRQHKPGQTAAENSHYTDVIMSAIASQITSLTIVYSTVYSDADQRKHHSSASLAFVWGIHRGPVNSPHKWPVTRKMFLFDDVTMKFNCGLASMVYLPKWWTDIGRHCGCRYPNTVWCYDIYY